MPKVEKPRTRAGGSAGDALTEAMGAPMETAEAPLKLMQPAKPKFAPMTAHEQNGKRLEFRRVRP